MSLLHHVRHATRGVSAASSDHPEHVCMHARLLGTLLADLRLLPEGRVGQGTRHMSVIEFTLACVAEVHAQNTWGSTR